MLYRFEQIIPRTTIISSLHGSYRWFFLVGVYRNDLHDFTISNLISEKHNRKTVGVPDSNEQLDNSN